VDNTQAITHISLCTGYGGLDLGLRRAITGLRTIAYSEREGYACANLVSKMEAGFLDSAPIWTDVKTFPWSDFRDRVVILSGGYPCQPFSHAGKRLGTEDPRHLWPFIADGIRLMRPRMCFFENVAGHLTLGLSSVISDLEEIGYRCTFGIFSAREVGATHLRKRVFILAQDGDLRVEFNPPTRPGLFPARPGQRQHDWEMPRLVGNTVNDARFDVSRARCQQEEQSIVGYTNGNGEIMGNAASMGSCGDHPQARGSDGSSEQRWMLEPSGAGGELADTECVRSEPRRNDARSAQESESEHCCVELGNTDGKRPQVRAGDQETNVHGTHSNGGTATTRTTLADVGGANDGSVSRVDRLRLLGNGVVPATAELAFRTLYNKLNK